MRGDELAAKYRTDGRYTKMRSPSPFMRRNQSVVFANSASRVNLERVRPSTPEPAKPKTPEPEDPMVKTLNRVWMAYDKDGSGTLDSKEVKNFLTKTMRIIMDDENFEIDEQKLQGVLANIDDNADGVVSKEEIKDLMT